MFFKILSFLVLSLNLIYNVDTNEVLKNLKEGFQSEYEDPHSFYYNKRTKTQMKIDTQGSVNELGDSSLIQSSPHQECNRLFNECVNYKNDIPDELFSRRIINLLISVASFEKTDDLFISNIVIEVTPSQLEKLKNFGLGKLSIRDIDSMMPKIFKMPEKYIFLDILLYFKYLCVEAIIHKEIILGSLIFCWITWVIITTKWSMLKLISIMLMVVLSASFMITWLRLLKEAEIKHTIKQRLHIDLPSYCQPNQKTWWDIVRLTFSSSDDCHKHYETMMENPFLQVTPAQALSHMIGTFILQPAELIGDALSTFVHHSTKHFPHIIRIIVELLMIILILTLAVVAVILLVVWSMGLDLGPLRLFSLRGSSRSSNSKSINSTETREPIEVILNVKMPQDGETHQLFTEAPKQTNTVMASLVDNKEAIRESIKDSSLVPKSEQLVSTQLTPLEEHYEYKSQILKTRELNINSGSGDSTMLILPLTCDEFKDTHESNLKASVVESGSGDN